jgi:hypothetical protein
LAFFVAVSFHQVRIRRTLSTFPRWDTNFSSRISAVGFFGVLFFYPGPVSYLCNLNDIHMKVTREQAQETIAKEVSAYLEKYGESTGVPLHILMSKESREHVIIVGTSIMMNRLGFNTYPGSFVQAVLDDSLSGAFNRADSINQQSLRFYATMMHSLRINISPE